MLTEFVYLAQKKGFRIKEIPINYLEQREDKTKLNLLKETIRWHSVRVPLLSLGVIFLLHPSCEYQPFRTWERELDLAVSEPEIK